MLMRTLTILAASLNLTLAVFVAPAANVYGLGAFYSPDRLFDQYGAIAWEDEMARLDNFAITLLQEPGSIGYILVYNGRRMCPGEAQARAIRAKRYVVEHRGVEWNRVIWREEGSMEEVTTILQPVMRGTIVPKPLMGSTVAHDEVQTVKKCGTRIRRIRQSKW